MKNKTKNKSKRPITSIFAFISFMYVVPTGILTHFGEHGLEQFQHMIGATHWTSSLIFLVSAIYVSHFAQKNEFIVQSHLKFGSKTEAAGHFKLRYF